MIESQIKKFKDQNSNDLYITEKIGSGGQGMVYRTKDRNIAVKFLSKDDEIINDQETYNSFKEKIEEVIILKTDETIHICKPEVMLESPTCGYVMKLLNDLVPVSELIYTNEGNFTTFFKETLGIKKRLEVLIELSKTLAKLHTDGIIYGDISPNNVFFSKKSFYTNVWLIDCDNMHTESGNITRIYTPGYGAPEVVNSSPNTIFSDIYSFAILGFKILSSRNPFRLVNDDGATTNGWDASTKSNLKNIKNEYIWDLENANDDNLVLFYRNLFGDKLMDLFNRTFCKDNIFNPTSRPSMRIWYKTLIETYNRINLCECGSYHFAAMDCMWCNAKPNIKTYLTIYRNYSTDNVKKMNNVLNRLEDEDDFYPDSERLTIKSEIIKSIQVELEDTIPIYDGFELRNFQYSDFHIGTLDKPIVSFLTFNKKLIINNHCDELYVIENGKLVKFGSERSLDPNSQILLTDNKITHGFKKIVKVVCHEK